MYHPEEPLDDEPLASLARWLCDYVVLFCRVAGCRSLTASVGRCVRAGRRYSAILWRLSQRESEDCRTRARYDERGSSGRTRGRLGKSCAETSWPTDDS